MNLDCTYHFLKPDEPMITVGDMFEAHCKVDPNSAQTSPSPGTGSLGAAPSGSQSQPGGVSGLDPNVNSGPVDLAKLKVKFDEGKNYDLVIVRSAESGDQINFAMTSYSVGKKDLAKIILTDGKQELAIQSPLQFEVKSILKPEDKPEMFGPMSGLSVAIPFFYWVLLGSVIFILVSSIGAVARRRWKRRKMLQRLDALEDGTKPIQQFFTNYRKLQRENAIFSARSDSHELDSNGNTGAFSVENSNQSLSSPLQSPEELLRIVKNVEQSLKVFFARTFRIATLELSWRNSIHELEKYHELVHEIFGAELLELSREFMKVGLGRNKLEPKDAILISEKTRKWVEKADQLHKAILSKDTQQIKKMRGAGK